MPVVKTPTPEDIDPLDDFSLLHIPMTQQKPSSEAYFPPVIHFQGTSVFLYNIYQGEQMNTHN